MDADIPSTTTLEEKRVRLGALLRRLGSVCIGYSGGVDSAFLAVAALRELGAGRVLAVTGLSPAYPRVQLEQARACALQFGLPHLELATHELDDPSYAANPTNRCYFCKTELWTRLRAVAAARRLAAVCDGSNADDVGDHRPGSLAAAEHGVHSPLLEAGLAKHEIRALSRELGLPTWEAPASPCLASRLAYGVAVTPERLRAVEQAEEALRALGFREFRVRHHGDTARIETSPAELSLALESAARLAEAGRDAGFERVLIDVEGYRRGALNSAVPLVQIGPRHDPLAAVGALLDAAGIDSPVTRAGRDGDILAVAAPAQRAAALARLAAEIRAAGFRFIALEPTAPCAA
jgi:pyridinium-3,5-biscarboxylic acid mononucleotide sulfurtransferase